MKVVINTKYGGFSVSREAVEFMAARGNDMARRELQADNYYGCSWDSIEHRTDPDLLLAVASLGKRANGRYSKLAILDIPDDIDWTIEEYDGLEWIAETHRTWYGRREEP